MQQSTLAILACPLACVMLAIGCFDVRVTDVDLDAGETTALLIADFEHNSRVPNDEQFGPWRGNTYNSPETHIATWTLTSPGFDYSNYAYSVDFVLLHTTIGSANNPGVALETFTKNPVDVSEYERFVLSAKLDADCGAVPTGVYLRCSTVRALDPTYQSAFVRMPTQMLGPEWEIVPLNLSGFQLVSWNGPLFDKRDCLRQIDGIKLGVEPALSR